MPNSRSSPRPSGGRCRGWGGVRCTQRLSSHHRRMQPPDGAAGSIPNLRCSLISFWRSSARSTHLIWGSTSIRPTPWWPAITHRRCCARLNHELSACTPATVFWRAAPFNICDGAPVFWSQWAWILGCQISETNGAVRFQPGGWPAIGPAVSIPAECSRLPPGSGCPAPG